MRLKCFGPAFWHRVTLSAPGLCFAEKQLSLKALLFIFFSRSLSPVIRTHSKSDWIRPGLSPWDPLWQRCSRTTGSSSYTSSSSSRSRRPAAPALPTSPINISLGNLRSKVEVCACTAKAVTLSLSLSHTHIGLSGFPPYQGDTCPRMCARLYTHTHTDVPPCFPCNSSSSGFIYPHSGWQKSIISFSLDGCPLRIGTASEMKYTFYPTHPAPRPTGPLPR